QCTTSSKRHQAQADGFNYAEWADHIEQKISQQKLRKYLTSSTRFEHYDEDDDYVAKSYINLSVHRKNLKYFKETDLEKAHPSTIHTNLARHRLKDVHEKTTIVNNMLLRRELWSLSWKPHETFEAKVDWILERITKQDPEYCSLIGVIKSVEIGWSFMALHGHQGRSKGLDPSHYLQQLVRIRCESSASVTADVESAYLVANEAPSIWHARLGYPPPAPTQAILKVTHGGPSKLPSPDSCDGCVSPPLAMPHRHQRKVSRTLPCHHQALLLPHKGQLLVSRQRRPLVISIRLLLSPKICKRKLHPDGTTAHKAWLVNRGYHQQYGINYLVTYSLTVKDESMHMTLA
ncbi:hypothetical protein DYB31_013586, partial [Aphanomyces astaci]